MATASISDSSGEIILTATKRLSSTNVLMSEVASALSTWLVVSAGVRHFLLEGDAFLVILAVN